MRSRVLPLLFVVAVLFAFSAYAQKSIDPAIERDPLLEADAKHNLDVAWQSFNVKKAYKGVLLRFEETYAAYPDFSKMEEFLYLAGMSSYYLSKNEGKQKVNLKVSKEKERYDPDKLREEAAAYLSEMLKKNPESKYKNDAQRILKELVPAN